MQIGYDGLKFRPASRLGPSAWRHTFAFADLALWTCSGEKFIFYFEVRAAEPGGSVARHTVAVGHIREARDAMAAVAAARARAPDAGREA